MKNQNRSNVVGNEDFERTSSVSKGTWNEVSSSSENDITDRILDSSDVREIRGD